MQIKLNMITTYDAAFTELSKRLIIEYLSDLDNSSLRTLHKMVFYRMLFGDMKLVSNNTIAVIMCRNTKINVKNAVMIYP